MHEKRIIIGYSRNLIYSKLTIYPRKKLNMNKPVDIKQTSDN